ncbi:hypothetical protein BCR43DRAFT_498042 [Syncephalastrum racemosum]|uniref:Uncharacterized protein n=1 Tax=Syncephalastrum racemosum TaxID=13706 RepID=A0A1X2H3F1_SYNRA|nr:hypothetical protein BCR43DRAFT_498042 [Syncephalastrum racemosum]
MDIYVRIRCFGEHASDMHARTCGKLAAHYVSRMRVLCFGVKRRRHRDRPHLIGLQIRHQEKDRSFFVCSVSIKVCSIWFLWLLPSSSNNLPVAYFITARACERVL